ncbi:MAG: Crp/Fnr family transcriptional regulator [Verrucomicrobiales bacterium]|nr:Crp/Fnr family transcriptional regulator [Verrucomicrobiales bacterium]
MTPARPDARLVALHNTLRRCDLFAGLSSEDLSQIAQLTVLRSVERGEYLFHEGEASRGFYIVQTGSICVHRVNAAGKEQVIYVFRSGQTFAEAALATEGGYPADARATEPSTVLLVQKAGFVELLKQRPELALRMLASMAIHLRTLIGQLEDLTMKDVETRLANWLLKQLPAGAAPPTPTQPHLITLSGTKRALAAELGTVSETFSRTLAKLRELGLIEVDGPRISLLDPAGLKALLKRNLGE